MAEQKPGTTSAKPGNTAQATTDKAQAQEAAPAKTKRERFKEYAPPRVREVLKKLEILGNCSNTAGYEYEEAEIQKIKAAIQKKLDETMALFTAKKKEETISFEL